MVITYSKSKDQPGKVAKPARGQLKRENKYSLAPGVRVESAGSRISICLFIFLVFYSIEFYERAEDKGRKGWSYYAGMSHDYGPKKCIIGLRATPVRVKTMTKKVYHRVTRFVVLIGNF